MAFELFTGRQPRADTAPTITISRRQIIINKAARDALGRPDRVELLFNTGERRVGLRPAPADSPNGYSLSNIRDGGSAAVHASAFIEYYDIDVATTRRRAAVLTEGVLCADLDDPGTIVTSNRATRSPSPAAAE